MVSSSTKRRAVKYVVGEGLGGNSQACRALGLARSSFYYVRRLSEESREIRDAVFELAQSKPRSGYRRVTELLRRAGRNVNPKRVQRIRRIEGLQVRKKQRKMKRVGLSTARRQQACYPNHVWSWDFLDDQTENGTRFRILTVNSGSPRMWLGRFGPLT